MRIRPDPARLDMWLAAALFVGAELQVLLGDSTGWRTASQAAVGAVVTASVAVRRRFPVAVGLGVQGLLVLEGLYSNLPAGAVSVAWFCALYALTVWTSWPWFVAGQLFFVISNLLPSLGDPVALQMIGNFTAVAVLIMVLLRVIVGGRERQLRVAERERDLARREAVVEERARIARELHDAIAHHVSMMVIQAGAERRVLDPAQGSTHEVLSTIERIGRSALIEMRRLVGMLRSDQADDLLPQPSLTDVPSLVAQLRDAGLPVELSVEGERRELPVGIELSAYRVVQEGLTNALKHAGRAHVSVRIRYGPGSLELEIADDGTGDGAAADVPGGGHGLVGIQERVSLYGGRLETGRAADGGFRLRVLLPIR
jgi:signal transduction histidine kinase